MKMFMLPAGDNRSTGSHCSAAHSDHTRTGGSGGCSAALPTV